MGFAKNIEFRFKLADFADIMRISPIVAYSAPAQFFTIFYYLFVDTTNCSGFRNYCCGFSKFLLFLEQL